MGLFFVMLLPHNAAVMSPPVKSGKSPGKKNKQKTLPVVLAAPAFLADKPENTHESAV